MKKSPSSLHFCKILFLFIFNLTIFAQENIVIKDSLGDSFSFKSPPQKIVSLSPAITEILFYIGAGDRVAGVTRYCDFPEQAKEKEKIGGIIDVNIENILRIEPDIVFATRGNPLEIIKRLKDMGIKVFAVDMGGEIEDIFEAMRKISIVIGNFQRSRERILELEKKVKEIEKKAEGIKVKKRIFLKLGSQGLWTCGKRTYINDLILKGGCKNIADFKEGWFEINIENLISKNPDIIIILSRDEKDFLSTKNSLLSLPGISTVNAVKNDSIFRLNVDIVERPGPRIVEALEEIYKISYGSRKIVSFSK